MELESRLIKHGAVKLSASDGKYVVGGATVGRWLGRFRLALEFDRRCTSADIERPELCGRDGTAPLPKRTDALSSPR